MRTIDKGLVICTAGHANELLEKTGIAESMRKIMLDDRLGDRFSKKKMIILGGTLDGEKIKEQHLKSTYEKGLNFEKLWLEDK